jgi:hypothetical protein
MRRGVRKRNGPPQDQPWVWISRDMLESDAWRSMTRAERLVLDRIVLEHMAHGGAENGNLPVTHEDFIKFGVSKNAVAEAIKGVSGRGLAIIIRQGRSSKGCTRWPTHFALGWLPTCDGIPPPNAWQHWRCPPPTYQDIDSTPQNGGREVRRNYRGSPPKRGVAATHEMGGRESRKSNGAHPPKRG